VVSSWYAGGQGNERPWGVSMDVWNSTFLEGSFIRGDRCAWWIGWERRT
jgi:hypothetical protein